MKTASKWRAAWALAAIAALQGGMAQAFSLFGPDANTRAANYMRRADATLTRADAAYEGGNLDQALTLYERAGKAYTDLHRSHPKLHDGLPRYRLDYCSNQIVRIQARLRGAPSTEFEPVATGGVEVVAAPAGGRPAFPAASPPEAAALADGDGGGPAPSRRQQWAADLAEARALLDNDQLDDAARLLAQLLREDPGQRSARLMIAMVRSRQGRNDEALAALEDLRGAGEDLPLLLALAGAYAGAGRHFDAMLALDKAVALAPEHPHAYVNLAWLRLTMSPGAEGLREAEAYYRRAIKLGARRDWQLERKLGLE